MIFLFNVKYLKSSAKFDDQWKISRDNLSKKKIVERFM